MSSIELAFIAMIANSLLDVVWKHALNRGVCPWATLILFHLLALILFLPFVSLSEICSIDFQSFCFLTLASLFWVFGDFFRVRGYESLDLAVCHIYLTLKLALVTLAGVFIFGESLSAISICGITLIVFAIVHQLNPKALSWNRGTTFCFLSAVFLSAALITDKHLTTMVSDSVIVFYAFFMPTVAYAIVGLNKIRNIPEVVRSTNGLFILCPILGVLGYHCLVSAFSRGDLLVTNLIQELAILFVFIFEMLFLRAYDDLPRKAFACMVCLIGAIIVCGQIP